MANNEYDERKYLNRKRHRLVFGAQLSALYHQKRERFFDFLDKSAKAVSIIGGSAVLAKLASANWLVWIALAITVASTISLVFGLSDKARRHADFARSFRALEAKIIGKGERDYVEADLTQWDAELCTLEATEPSSLGALVVACQNELATAMDRPGNVVDLSWWQRWTMHLVDWDIKSRKPATSPEPAASR